jgi:hypothetical protein
MNSRELSRVEDHVVPYLGVGDLARATWLQVALAEGHPPTRGRLEGGRKRKFKTKGLNGSSWH